MEKQRLYSLDSDLPLFSQTKYNSQTWRIWHAGTYFLFTAFSVFLLFDYTFTSCLCYIISSFFFCLSSFTEYFHFQRGCIGLSNLNSTFKTNRKKNCKTILLRSEYGIYYFLSVISGLMLLTESIIFLLFYNKNKSKSGAFKSIAFYCNFALISFMIMFVSQLFKLGKITLRTSQYSWKKDRSNVIKEALVLFASFCYIVGFASKIFILSFRKPPSYFNIPFYADICGCIFLFLSLMTLIFRYFLSGYDDLNMDGMSFVTI